jgi:hypothetical protein
MSNSPSIEFIEVLKMDEERKYELKQSLPALSAADQTVVDAAKKSYTPPKAVNEDDDNFSSAEFKSVENTVINDFYTIPQSTNTSPYSEEEQMITSMPESKKPTEFTVSASNDIWNNSAFSEFESNHLSSIVKEHNIEVKTQTDANGKTFYLFDNSLNRTLVVVTFYTLNTHMIKINNVILPLEKFLSLKQCIGITSDDKITLGSQELRLSSAPFVFGSVRCIFSDNSRLRIDNISVDEIMTVVSYLSKLSISCEDAETYDESDGESDGELDGELDGEFDGELDGEFDGELDGESEGKSDTNTSTIHLVIDTVKNSKIKEHLTYLVSGAAICAFSIFVGHNM